ncbi:MAG: 2-polyprenyl-3-methyl-6-methoxy-1,4-benzoquinone monooxygenase [Pseudomonadales bacterium]
MAIDKLANVRRLSFIDRVIGSADEMLKTFAGGKQLESSRPSPADQLESQNESINDQQRVHTAALMRVNHTGEVCAQALYRGQSLSAKSESVRRSMMAAAAEEEDHLVWCEKRIHELGSHTSYLNPLWYAMSFSMGALTGILSDKISLGFVAATEEQVCKHLNEHYEQIPGGDLKSRAILEQMLIDENSHAEHAIDEGGLNFPGVVKQSMTVLSKAMTGSSYHL